MPVYVYVYRVYMYLAHCVVSWLEISHLLRREIVLFQHKTFADFESRSTLLASKIHGFSIQSLRDQFSSRSERIRLPASQVRSRKMVDRGTQHEATIRSSPYRTMHDIDSKDFREKRY